MTTAERIARLLERVGFRHVCPHCDPTAKAIRHVQAQWVVAGIDRGE